MEERCDLARERGGVALAKSLSFARTILYPKLVFILALFMPDR